MRVFVTIFFFVCAILAFGQLMAGFIISCSRSIDGMSLAYFVRATGVLVFSACGFVLIERLNTVNCVPFLGDDDQEMPFGFTDEELAWYTEQADEPVNPIIVDDEADLRSELAWAAEAADADMQDWDDDLIASHDAWMAQRLEDERLEAEAQQEDYERMCAEDDAIARAEGYQDMEHLMRAMNQENGGPYEPILPDSIIPE